MRLGPVLFLCFLCSSNPLWAYPDSLWAVQQLQCARELLPVQPDSAMVYAKESWAVFQRNDDLYNWLSWHQKIGKTWREKLDRPFIAVDILQKGLTEKNRAPQTEREYKRLAWLYAETGRTYEKSMHDYASTRDYYGQAKAIFVDTLGQEDFTVARFIYTNLGNAHTRLRDFEHAEYYLGKVRRISSEAGEWSKYVEASSDLSKVYINQGNYKKAVEVLEEALLWKDSIAPRAQWFLYEGLAVAHYRAEAYVKALPYLDRVQGLLGRPGWPLSDDDRAFLRQEVWITKGRVYKGLKEYGQAEDYFVRARRILDAHFAGEADRAFAFLDIYQGWLYVEWGKPESAVQHFQAALQHLLDGFKHNTILDNPSQDQLSTASLLTFAFEGKAAALMDQYQAGAVGKEGVKSAVRCYDLAEAVYQKLWEQYILEGSKLTALKDRRKMREAAVDAAYILWQQEGGTHWVEKMFALSEQSRALLLMEQLQRADALEQAPVTNNIRQAYRQLSTEMEYLSYTLHHSPQRAEAGWAASADSLEARIRAAKIEQRILLKKAAERYPGTQLGQAQTLGAAKHFRQQLQKGEALVEYFITGAHLYVFVLDPGEGSLLAKRLSWNEAWAHQAASVKEDLYGGRGAAASYVSKARALYQHLIDPVLQLTAAQHLILVPDGVLWNVPFDALLTEEVAEEDIMRYRAFQYLIHEKQISYALSAAVLSQTMQDEPSQQPFSLLAYAPAYHDIKKENSSPPYLASRMLLDTLIYNQQEAEEIVSMWDGKLIGDAAATRAHFLEFASQSDILHVAAHAKANHSDPKYSFIAFANTGDTLNQDYKLYTHELYHQRLPLHMAVLSACETGTGPIQQGEGLISIARAFSYAGAESVVTSLWSIPDASTKKVMVRFYTHLKQGKTKAEALRSAKLDYIENATHATAHPLHWAAFSVIGNPQALSFNGQGTSWKYAYYGAGLLLLLVVIVGRRSLIA